MLQSPLNYSPLNWFHLDYDSEFSGNIDTTGDDEIEWFTLDQSRLDSDAKLKL